MPTELRSRKLDPDESSVDDGTSDKMRIRGDSESQHHPKQGIKGDERNIAVLLFLYILQGIPLGLAAAVPLILTNRHVSYKQQAEFSFSYWPFSIKLLWAPIVDSLFIASFGRRKTWLVPVQYLIGVTMMVLSRNVDFYLGEGGREPDVFSLTCMFFFLNFLAATQDIAVDGWALTMLQPHNVGYASTCNSVGQTAGYFMGYVFYMGLESYGLVTLSGFLFFWGIVFMVATTLVAIFKHETNTRNTAPSPDAEPDLGVVETYKLLYKIITLPLMPVTIFILLTGKIGFSAADSVSSLKLIEQGVPKDKLAMLGIPMIPLQIMLPWVISRYTAGPKPMTVWLRSVPPRLIMGVAFAWIVWITPSFKQEDGSFPVTYYAIIVGLYGIYQVFLYCMFVSVMAFFARISDPAVGGTYMTLLNTLTNLGGNWPATLALWWVDFLTTKECQGAKDLKGPSDCAGATETGACEAAGGSCVTLFEGYYLEIAICCAIGFAWLAWAWGAINRLQDADLSEWRVVKKRKAEA